jgi:hypothetical protein
VQYFGVPAAADGAGSGRHRPGPAQKRSLLPIIRGSVEYHSVGAPCNGCGVEFFVAGGGELLNYFSRLGRVIIP